ncbi:MAG: cytochrome-c oxidase [Gammaproteobacteria bacterium RIFCSPLOWO2_02_FULL_52_10]|nr:MAG: cytochrome-c oxidase [Gammaproteobacteria bacterium RIFCSPLOWO2_02_FULL_52_10]
MPLAVVIILLVVATIVFHFASPWWFTPIASNWGTIDTTVQITFWVTGAVFIAINLFLAYVIVKYRHKEAGRAHYEPENTKLEVWLTSITALGVAAMLAPGLFVWADFVNVPEDAAEVEVVGQQWRWSYRFPGADGVFGSTDIPNMSVDNPFGINPDDPAGQDDILVNDNTVHVPLNKPIKFLLRSKDVLHDFAVAQFRVKMDLVPGMVTYIWLTPTKTGTYDILCEELCGMAHYAMRGAVVVNEENEFDSWLSKQPTFAQTAARSAGDPVAGQAFFAVCAACHGAQGEGNLALNAPKTAGQQSWYIKRQINAFKGGFRGTHKDDIYGMQMAPMAATLVDENAIDNVVAYINTLPDNPPETTVTGDVARGGRLYTSCAVCHGRQGQGIWSQDAPRLAGMTDWYLALQLKNFKAGVRGSHASDFQGRQMALLSLMLKDDQAIQDIVAYINTL